MKTSTVSYKDVLRACRLDTPFFLSDGNKAARIIERYLSRNDSLSLNDKNQVDIWQPKRNTMVYAGEGEAAFPYLQPYDILEYYPVARSFISSHQDDIESFKVDSGTILQTCSGRNLGPLVIADQYLEQFRFGSDLIRITVKNEEMRYYVFGFFNTWIGQALLHYSKTGSVVDHLSKKDIEKIKVPLLPNKDMKVIVNKIGEYYCLSAEARSMIQQMSNEYNKRIKVLSKRQPLKHGWTVSSKSFMKSGRIDSAYFDPYTIDAAKRLKKAGGVQLLEKAESIKPGGRNKTNYVEAENGMPFISGRQLLQHDIVSLKYLPRFSAEKYKDFQLKENWTAYPADGRVEGRLGTPTFITSKRAEWYASAHVGRVIPKPGVHPGYIYLAMMHPVVQEEICALACGSVVDSIYPADMEGIILPPCIDFDYDAILIAWDKFDRADRLKKEACELFEKALLKRNE